MLAVYLGVLYERTLLSKSYDYSPRFVMFSDVVPWESCIRGPCATDGLRLTPLLYSARGGSFITIRVLPRGRTYLGITPQSTTYLAFRQPDIDKMKRR